MLRHGGAVTVGHTVLAQIPRRMFDVTTLRLPPFSGAGTCSQRAADSPCHVGWAPDEARAVKRKRRVCVPASVSTRSVSASCQVMCNRPGHS